MRNEPVLDREALQFLAEKPLDTAERIGKIWLPLGRKPAPRATKPEYIPQAGDLTPAQVRERKAKAFTAKQQKLLDYYATTDLEAETVARHIGMFRMVETGTDDKGKPIVAKVLDVEGVAAQLAWRRKAA